MSIDSISLYFKAKKEVEQYIELEDLKNRIQIKIKESSNYQSGLQDKIMKLIDIVSITKQIEVEKLELKNYECPFCGEIIDAQLIQKYKDGPTVKCKYCEVNIPKDELLT